MARTVRRFERFRVLSILPGDGWEAVFTDDDGSEFSDTLDFIGAADAFTDTVFKSGEVRRGTESISCIVGITIDEHGCDYIVNESSNFVRIQRAKANPQTP